MISVVVSDDENSTGFVLAPELVEALVGGPRQQRKELKRNIGDAVGLCVQQLAVAVKGVSVDAEAEKAEVEGQADQEVI